MLDCSNHNQVSLLRSEFRVDIAYGYADVVIH